MISFKTKNLVISILVILFLYLFISWKTWFPTQATVHPSHNRTTSRLTSVRRQTLASALAHIRVTYSTNRTPEISIPPLLVLYSCKPHQQCGTLAERMVDITSAYYYAMLHPDRDAAFAYDMAFPVQFEWYLEPTPGHMAMRTGQAQFYLDRADRDEVKHVPILSSPPTVEGHQRILGTTVWKSREWNATESPKRGRYGLGHVPDRSDWFFLASRLLFAQPTDWLAEQLGPYRRLMGGKIKLKETMGALDPDNVLTPHLTSAWFRLGVCVRRAEEVDRMTAHVRRVCPERGCHVFVSAASAHLLDRVRRGLSGLSVHAVAEGYAFGDLDRPPQHWKLFESNEQLKKQYARVFMDWLILSRMDYLIGSEEDLFVKTAAWSAQVQTDVLTENGKFVSLSDW
ncbi:hypothetical protein G6F49_009759 [Rhizopus delemar]|nr:hypothetical protein G6F49_009759 [Rhizopus delemar]